MNNSNKKRKRIIFISFGMFALLVTTTILLFAFRSGIEFYKSPTQLLEVRDETIRLRVGGFVASQVLAKHDEKYMPRELEKTLGND